MFSTKVNLGDCARLSDYMVHSHRTQSDETSGSKANGDMRYSFQYSWFPNTSYEGIAKRTVGEHEKDANYRERMHGWYALAGGGAGFLLASFGDPRERMRFLQFQVNLMNFDGRAIHELKCIDEIEHLHDVVLETVGEHLHPRSGCISSLPLPR